jgi:hypothetical protein
VTLIRPCIRRGGGSRDSNWFHRLCLLWVSFIASQRNEVHQKEKTTTRCWDLYLGPFLGPASNQSTTLSENRISLEAFVINGEIFSFPWLRQACINFQAIRTRVANCLDIYYHMEDYFCPAWRRLQARGSDSVGDGGDLGEWAHLTSERVGQGVFRVRTYTSFVLTAMVVAATGSADGH